MRCLGIKFSDEFMNITKQEDAQARMFAVVLCLLCVCSRMRVRCLVWCVCCSGGEARQDDWSVRCCSALVGDGHAMCSCARVLCVIYVHRTWRQEDDEEFEDREGNVYSKKVYDDLARQGLLA